VEEDAEANLESVEEAVDNLQSIEKAQQRVRTGSDNARIIDDITKSMQKVANELKKITSLDDVE